MKFWFFIAVILTLPAFSKAACTSPAGVRGQFQVTGSGASEDFRVCDGSFWVSASRSGALGSCGSVPARSFKWEANKLSVCLNLVLYEVIGTNLSATTCAKSGAVYFEEPTGELRFCANNNKWTVAATGATGDPCSADDPPAGTVCTSGEIYVGKFKNVGEALNYKYYVTPSGCTATTPTTCSGGTDLTRAWLSPSTNVSGVESMIETSGGQSQKSTQSGETVRATLVAAGSPAALYCNGMDFASKNTWFLPSKSEMAFLFCNTTLSPSTTSYPQEDQDCATYRRSANAGERIASSWSATYWVATQNQTDTTEAWSMGFTSAARGTQTAAFGAKANLQSVRCMNRVAVP